jgi:hypothetical protein
MKKFASALVLLSGLALLAGCDAMTQNWLPIAADHRPTVTTSQITGFVVDTANNELAGAMVSNGASVTFTKSDGSFTLANVRTGVQYITATYDNVKSQPVEIEVTSGSNTIPKIVVGATAPVSDMKSFVKYAGIFPDTLTATYSIDIATASATESATPSYSTAKYTGTKEIQISLQAPPNGDGLRIASYRVTYAASAAATFSANFSPTIWVEPGSPTGSGPLKNLIIKNVGPTSNEFAEFLDKSETGLVEATIKLYTKDKDQQLDANAVLMHVPEQGNKDNTIPFSANVTIQRAEQ